MLTERTTPSSDKWAEEAILGGILRDGTGKIDGVDHLKPADFWDHRHSAIFGACWRLIDRDAPTNPLAVAEELGAVGDLAHAGGRVMLEELCELGAAPCNIPHWVAVVRRHAMARRFESILRTAASDFAEHGVDAEALRDTLIDSLGSVGIGSGDEQVEHISEILPRVLREMEEAKDRKGTGLSTGFYDLDNTLGGIADGALAIIAGRPSMGKSALCTDIIRHVAKDGTRVLLFTLEMSKSETTQRDLSAVSRIPLKNIRASDMSAGDWSETTAAAASLAPTGVWVCDEQVGIGEMRAIARKWARVDGAGLVVVDYIQLATGEGDNREQEVDSIARGLKSLARELDCPVIAAAQLNRAVEHRTSKRPLISDLRESGGIENHADVIMLLYRSDYYDSGSSEAGTVEIIVGKNRQGPTGIARLGWKADQVRFYNLERNRS